MKFSQEVMAWILMFIMLVFIATITYYVIIEIKESQKQQEIEKSKVNVTEELLKRMEKEKLNSPKITGALVSSFEVKT